MDHKEIPAPSSRDAEPRPADTTSETVEDIVEAVLSIVEKPGRGRTRRRGRAAGWRDLGWWRP